MTASLLRGQGVVRRVARRVLVAAVRGRGDQGRPWGEAILAEFDETRGRWEAIRWTAGGVKAVWRERRTTVVPRRVPRGVLVAVLTVAGAVLLNQFVLSSRYVPSGGMSPTLPVMSRFLVDRVSFHITGLHHGDIVVFRYTNEPGVTPTVSSLVKRVIGLPGDTVTCRDGKVWRNGERLDEPYLPTDAAEAASGDCPTVTVPSGELYVLGDNRFESMDSRQWGPIQTRDVEGRLLLRYR